MPGSIIKGIKNFRCGWDSRVLAKQDSQGRPGHSHKELMKCLYRSNVELYRMQEESRKKDEEIKNLQSELARYIIKEDQEKMKIGLLDVKPDEELANDLLEVESTIDEKE